MKAFTNSALVMKPRKRWALPPSRPAARDRHLRRSSCLRGQKRCLSATRTRSGLSLIDLYEALVLFTEGRLFEARRLCAAAHEFFRTSTSSMRGKAVLAELLLARIALRLADTGLAKQHCQRGAEGPRESGFADASLSG